jgi:ABC-type phosphate/phosphonate transport system ATPase subunit
VKVTTLRIFNGMSRFLGKKMDSRYEKQLKRLNVTCIVKKNMQTRKISSTMSFATMNSRWKVVLIGDKKSGKTELFKKISGNVQFNSGYEPTSSDKSEENYQKDITVNGQKVNK